ncbi:PilZ domain-containing protein [Candidatus Pelagadaptatus aseana]|uniref:PilZ domain-containing protein n=1 Tax=Candidatus Pelagadaptatus aseana TaxID=3120508 RepID=UPI003C6F2E4E
MNLASRDYSEKRNFLRMQIGSPVTITLPDSDEEITGKCIDLSGGGMSVEISRVFPVGAKLTICIMPPVGCTPMLNAHTQVTRVESGPDDGCILGLEITEVLPTS